MKIILRILLITFALWLIVNAVLVPFIEYHLTYLPLKGEGLKPSSIDLKYEDLFIQTADGSKINAWFIKNNATDKVVLILHGNAGNLSVRLPQIKTFYSLPANILIIDYHGYGISEGKASEKNFYLDAQAAYNYLIEVKKFKPEQVFVMGTSLGGGVATNLAAEKKVGGLILRNTFTSMSDYVQNMNPFYRRPLIWIRDKYDNLEKIDKINAPLLIVHAKQDRFVPYQMGIKLYEKAKEPKTLLLLERYQHVDFIDAPEYVEKLRKILGYKD